MKSIAKPVVFVIAFLISNWLMAAQLAEKKTLTLEVAKQVAGAAEAEAAKNKWNVVIVVVDEGGHLVYLEKLDDTQYGSIDVAIKKAQTSIAFKRPTKVFEDAIAGGRTALIGLSGALPLEGGVPLTVDGKIIGAVGVSGATSQQDGQVAKAGADALSTIVAR
jgi:glc operon protein GlcG